MRHERIRRPHDQVVKDDRAEFYAEHRREMKRRGFDPDFIGVTEVAPVCCKGCGTPIPWRTLRGWQD